MRHRTLIFLRAFALAACGLLLAGGAQAAGPVARVFAEGEIAPPIYRTPGGPWGISKDKQELPAGTQIVGGIGATLDSADGAVRVRLIGDVGGHSPFPILESSIIFREPKNVDLEIELDRGRVDLINSKKSGPAKIRVWVHGKSGEVTLQEPGTRLVIQMYSRWSKGTRFNKKPKETDVPSLSLLLIAVKGEVELKGDKHTLTLKAPPGPALLHLDSIQDTDPNVQTLEEIPEWIETVEPELLQKMRNNYKKLRDLAEKMPLEQVLLAAAASPDEGARRMAIVLLGALDDLPSLALAVTASKYDDVPENGVLVLRHWIGRGPGQDLKLYNSLVEKAMFRPVEAELVLQLLHSFGGADLKKPSTYEALIHYLDNDRLAVRCLANWHLVRLVPEGRKIGYKPVASKEEREKSIKTWRELLPEGTLPGIPKLKEE